MWARAGLAARHESGAVSDAHLAFERPPGVHLDGWEAVDLQSRARGSLGVTVNLVDVVREKFSESVPDRLDSLQSATGQCECVVLLDAGGFQLDLAVRTPRCEEIDEHGFPGRHFGVELIGSQLKGASRQLKPTEKQECAGR